jgi:hypothetical protein
MRYALPAISIYMHVAGVKLRAASRCSKPPMRFRYCTAHAVRRRAACTYLLCVTFVLAATCTVTPSLACVQSAIALGNTCVRTLPAYGRCMDGGEDLDGAATYMRYAISLQAAYL